MTAPQSSALTARSPHTVPRAEHLHRQPHTSDSLRRLDGGSDPFIELIVRRRFRGHPEFQHHSHALGAALSPSRDNPCIPKDEPVDFLFLAEKDPHQPEDVFDRLRWGGQVVLVSRNRGVIESASQAFKSWRMEESDHAAWLVEHPLAIERKYLLNLPILGWRTPVYFMTARKVMLVPPGKSSDRFTYHVQLEKTPHSSHFEVVKEIPTLERVLARLREKFPEADEDTLRRRARKFTDKIFPVFLTRETAMLKLLQRDLPKKFRNRIPTVLYAKTDEYGFTSSLRMNWLRNSRPVHHDAAGTKSAERKTTHRPPGRALSQIEFARQAAELLTALHDDVGIMHLDLRLDNVVITEHGVGFVDFGSAVRVGEEFPEASLLSNLFDEMMRTSQIQRMLGKMTESGQVTSEEITSSHERVDKAVDFFYLAVQINNPLSNPDFHGLVEYDPESREAQELAKLTEKILRPADPHKPEFSSAKDILKGIEEIDQRLQGC
jgi:Phosphotransferase enzyme family